MSMSFHTGDTVPEPEPSRPFPVDVYEAGSPGPIRTALIVAKVPHERGAEQEILLGHDGRQYIRRGPGLGVVELTEKVAVSIPKTPSTRRPGFSTSATASIGGTR